MGRAEVPEGWKVGEVIPILKGGDTKEAVNYRGITIKSASLKVVYGHGEEKVGGRGEQEQVVSRGAGWVSEGKRYKGAGGVYDPDE